MLSRWVLCHGRTPQSWYILNSLINSYLTPNLDYSTLWKSVEKPCHLLQWVLTFPDHDNRRHRHHFIFHWHQATNWAFNTAVAFAVPTCLSTIAWKTYFIFGTFNFAAFLHIYFMYPETVGRSLEEVEEIFKQGHVFSAWKIGKVAGKKTLKEVVEKSKDF